MSTAALRILSAFVATSLCLLLTASLAFADKPATVTVRVLGPASGGYEALTPITQITTTTAPVTKNGGSCSGTSAGGALELATQGNWEGNWSSKFSDYEVTTIDGKSFPFEEGATANYYWSFWLNNAEATKGVCEAELQDGDQVLFFPGCYSETGGCPPPSNLLSLQAPAAAEVNKPVTVTVRSYPSAGGEPTPVAGITVSGGGTSATTDAEGHAQLTFSGDGTYPLRAVGSAGEEPKAIPGEIIICAHNGNDGTCGTPAPAGSLVQTPASGLAQGSFYTGPYALVAATTSIHDGGTYLGGKGPRVLAGAVTSHASVTSISLRLRRTYRGRCWAYSGSRERLVSVRCRGGSFFKVASGGDAYSYLLPSRLPAGRYVLDVQAADSAGNRTALARGSSRIVFYVK